MSPYLLINCATQIFILMLAMKAGFGPFSAFGISFLVLMIEKAWVFIDSDEEFDERMDGIQEIRADIKKILNR